MKFRLRTCILPLFLFFLLKTAAQPKIIAHHGFWDLPGSAPNSLASIYKAAEYGIYGIEFDVHMTSDSILVVTHDDTVDGIVIKNASFTQIKDHKLSNGEVLVTLEQYFVHASNFPSLELFLEINADNKDPKIIHQFVSSILSMVDRFKLQNRTEYISPNLDVCKDLADRPVSRSISFIGTGYSLDSLKAAGLTGIVSDYSLYKQNSDLVNQIHDRALWANAWMVDDSVAMLKLISKGVDYIITNKTLLLRRLIDYYNKNLKASNYTPADLSMFKKDKDGFYILFDGKSLKGWRNYGTWGLSKKWHIDGDALQFDPYCPGGRGDIIFNYPFRNFELDLEWRISKGGNSGILYLIQEVPNQYSVASASEYQVLDNENHPDAKLGKLGNRKAGSLYDLIPANPQNALPAGEWNHATILVSKGVVSHFQNGKKVLSYAPWSPAWETLIADSKFSLQNWEDAYYLMTNSGGKTRTGYIGLQDHGNSVWYKNIKIKILDN